MSRLNYIYNIISPTLLDNVTRNEWPGQHEIHKKFSSNYVNVKCREKCFNGIGTINYAVKRIKNCH